jgi:hypothetical protein
MGEVFCSPYDRHNPESYDRERPEKIHIIKTHPYAYKALDPCIVLTSWRDREGVAKSLNRMFGSSLDDRKWSYICTNYQLWRERSIYDMDFRDLIDNPRSVFYEIAWSLLDELDVEFDFGVERVYERLRDLKPPADKEYDPITFLFKGHISSSDDYKS